jgi:hypothetical protein
VDKSDFRSAIRSSSKQSSRFQYFEHDARHYICCHFTADDDTMIVETLLEGMRDNQALLAMTDQDYRWEGGSVISFETKENAALFYLCCPR